MAEKKKKDIARVPYTVFCCQGSDCCKNGARETYKKLREEVRKNDLKNQVHFIKTECNGACKHGPMLIVCSGCTAGVCGAVWYENVQPADAGLITREHLMQGRPIESRRFFQRADELQSSDESEASDEGEASTTQTAPADGVCPPAMGKAPGPQTVPLRLVAASIEVAPQDVAPKDVSSKGMASKSRVKRKSHEKAKSENDALRAR